MYQNGPRLNRAIPGRMRLTVMGLKQNHGFAAGIIEHLYQTQGIRKVECSVVTGRIVIDYNHEVVTQEKVFASIQSFLNARVPAGMLAGGQETAAANEVFEGNQAAIAPKLPIPILLTVSGLTFLAVKQVFMGRAAIASNTVLYCLSGAISVISGYSFLNRGFKRFCKNNRLNADLVLGTGVLMLGLLRENLVVLASLSLVQYLNWQQNQIDQTAGHETFVSQAVEQYVEKASWAGVGAAGVVWAVTRNPLYGLAVMLAANPRPALLAEEFAWKQAELEVKKRKYEIPQQTTLAQMARTKVIVFEDSSLLFQGRDAADGTEKLTLELQQMMELKQKYGWEFGVLENSLHVPDEILYSVGFSTSWLTRDNEVIQMRVKEMRAQGKEILLVQDRSSLRQNLLFEQNKMGSVPFDKLHELQRTMDYANQIQDVVHQHLTFTKIWNVVGGVIAAPLTMNGIPVANILSDSVSLLLISRSKKLCTTISA